MFKLEVKEDEVAKVTNGKFCYDQKIKVPRRDGTINDGQINGVHFSKRDQCWKIDVRFVDPKDKREKFKSITLEELKEFNKGF